MIEDSGVDGLACLVAGEVPVGVRDDPLTAENRPCVADEALTGRMVVTLRTEVTHF